MKANNFLRYGKRLLLIGLCFVLCIGCLACRNTDIPSGTDESTESTDTASDSSAETKEQGVEEEITGEYAILENEKVRFSFDTEHGILKGICNKVSGREYLDSSRSNHGYYMTVDTSTGDAYETDINGISVDRYKQTAVNAALTKVRYSTRQELTVSQTFEIGDGNVTVTQVISLDNNGDSAVFSMQISNTASDAVVTSMRYVSVDNILDDEEGMDLLWPNREGEIFENALNPQNQDTFELSGIYPVPLSMQFLTLFSDTESLYYGVQDDNRAYKTISFSHDSRGQGTIQTTLWPFAEAQSEVTLPDIEIGVMCGDQWYTSADKYRTYLIENGYDKERGELATQFVGVHENGMIGYQNKYYTTYSQMVEVVSDNMERNGIPLTVFLGWHNDGFDSRYPDFKFSYGLGGESAFAQAMKDLDGINGYAVMYLNLHIAETKGVWFNTENENGELNGYACALRDVDGKVTEETYEDTASGLEYLAMCPSAQAYQDAIIAAGTRLAKNGADGLYLDQISCMPAALCYNKEHGHTNPATAYAEGYDEILQSLTDIMSQYSDNFIIMCEGTCDAYLKYIDVCAGNFTRLMDYADYAKTEVGRYILPTYFYGRRTALSSSMEASSYGHAFVLANGIFCQNTNSLAKRLAELMYANPDIYFNGRFMDQRGLADVPDGVYMSLFLSDDGKAASIHLFNDGKDAVSVKVQIDFEALGMEGTVVSIVNAETGEKISCDESGTVVSLPAKEAAAYLITIQ